MADETKRTPISQGSVVQLKSGGEWMTVERISGNDAVCVWMDGKKLNKAVFPAAILDNQEDWTPFV